MIAGDRSNGFGLTDIRFHLASSIEIRSPSRGSSAKEMDSELISYQADS